MWNWPVGTWQLSSVGAADVWQGVRDVIVFVTVFVFPYPPGGPLDEGKNLLVLNIATT
jgi:hypothetical protein